MFGVEEGGVEALRKDVLKNMERELEARRRSEIKRSAFDSLLAANAVDLPKALIEEEISSLQAAAMQQLGIKDAEQAPPRDNFQEHAERRAALALLVQELIRSREITVDASRVSGRIEELSAGYENPQQAAQQYRASRELMAQIESGILEDQCVDLLAEEAKTKPESISFEEFMR